MFVLPFTIANVPISYRNPIVVLLGLIDRLELASPTCSCWQLYIVLVKENLSFFVPKVSAPPAYSAFVLISVNKIRSILKK